MPWRTDEEERLVVEMRDEHNWWVIAGGLFMAVGGIASAVELAFSAESADDWFGTVASVVMALLGVCISAEDLLGRSRTVIDCRRKRLAWRSVILGVSLESDVPLDFSAIRSVLLDWGTTVSREERRLRRKGAYPVTILFQRDGRSRGKQIALASSPEAACELGEILADRIGAPLEVSGREAYARRLGIEPPPLDLTRDLLEREGEHLKVRGPCLHIVAAGALMIPLAFLVILLGALLAHWVHQIFLLILVLVSVPKILVWAGIFAHKIRSVAAPGRLVRVREGFFGNREAAWDTTRGITVDACRGPWWVLPRWQVWAEGSGMSRALTPGVPEQEARWLAGVIQKWLEKTA